ncbi:hypothetical protein CFP56_010543, partial [Quercus suber]
PCKPLCTSIPYHHPRQQPLISKIKLIHHRYPQDPKTQSHSHALLSHPKFSLTNPSKKTLPKKPPMTPEVAKPSFNPISTAPQKPTYPPHLNPFQKLAASSTRQFRYRVILPRFMSTRFSMILKWWVKYHPAYAEYT